MASITPVPLSTSSSTRTSPSSSSISITVAPLTTTFTAPPPCFSQLSAFFWNETVSSQIGGLSSWFSAGPDFNVVTSTCFPTSYNSAIYYSPGICPSGYSQGCLTTTTSSTNAETHAICCPNSWFCDTQTAVFTFDVGYNKPWVSDNPCVFYPTGSVVVRTGFSDFFTTTGISVNRPGISIRWKEGDFASSSTSMTSASTTTSSATSSATSSGASSGSSIASTGSSSGTLSTGAKAGIGIGVSITGLLFIFATLFFLFRRRRKNSNSKVETGESGEQTREQHSVEGYVKPELDASSSAAKFEIGEGILKKDIPSEMDAPSKAELGDGKDVLSEMDVTEKAELVGSRPPVYEMDADQGAGRGR